MAELIDAVVSWPSLLGVLVVFGFAPGFCLRLIVLAYPRGDPRRAELIAELYAVPRLQRPLWVAEQLEVALFEGLAHRVRLRSRDVRDGLVLWLEGMLVLVVVGGFVVVGVVVGEVVGEVVGGFVLVVVGGFVCGFVGLLVCGFVGLLVGRFRGRRRPGGAADEDSSEQRPPGDGPA